MTKNHIHKPTGEPKATSSAHRSSLWKRMGRRGSKNSSMIPPISMPPGAAIPLKSVRGDTSVENDIRDAQSISGKGSERKNGKSNGKGSGAGGLIRKLKNSIQKMPNNFSSDPNQSTHGVGDDDFGVSVERQRHGSSSRPNSPAYSINSYATVEVRRTEAAKIPHL